MDNRISKNINEIAIEILSGLTLLFCTLSDINIEKYFLSFI